MKPVIQLIQKFLQLIQTRIEQRATRTGRDASIALTTDGEVVARLVALIVAQDVGEVVGTLFGEADNALLEVGMQDGQAHAWLTERLHIPHAVVAPVVVVAPLVDL